MTAKRIVSKLGQSKGNVVRIHKTHFKQGLCGYKVASTGDKYTRGYADASFILSLLSI
jgi:hypothetical protein